MDRHVQDNWYLSVSEIRKRYYEGYYDHAVEPSIKALLDEIDRLNSHVDNAERQIKHQSQRHYDL